MTVPGVLAAWGGRRAESAARWLTLAGAATLPLQAAATLELGFTIRIPYVLLGLAVIVGLPSVLRGFRLLQPWLRWPALGLLVVYCLVTAGSDLATIEGTARGGSFRAGLYLTDLFVGVGVMCLVPTLWRGLGKLQPLLVAVTVGAGAAAAYALWQWPAQRYGWPLSNVVTTQDSNALTTGGFQGTGLLGWERARGTFLEPHFLGAFMSAAAPIAVGAAAQARGWARGLALGAAAASVLALIVSSSAPGYAGFLLAAVVGAAAWSVAAGRPGLAAVAACGAVAGLLAAPALLVAPEALATATGREARTLTITADFRKEAWDTALDVWSLRPAAGHGAGQSSVQITLADGEGTAAGLRSAQGLWAAALIDVGILGLGLWLALIGAVVATTLRTTWATASLASAALVAAAVAAVASTLIANDRLDLRVWLLFGVAAAAGLLPGRAFHGAPLSTPRERGSDHAGRADRAAAGGAG